MKAKRIYTHWPLTGDMPANIATNYSGYRRVDTALAFAFALGSSFLALSLWTIWRDLPLIGPLPGGARFLEFFHSWVCLVPHGLGAKTLCRDTVSIYFRWAGSVPWRVAYARPAIAGAITFFAASAGFSLGFSARSLEKVLDGAQVRDGDQEQSAVEALQAKLDSTDPHGKRWLRIAPGVRIPLRVACMHFLIAGGTGAGKTTFLWPIYNALRRKEGTRTFCFDPKGDFTKGTSKRVMLISPTDERSAVWQIGHDVNTPARAQAFADAVFSNNKIEYFKAAGGGILAGLIVALQENGESWGWGEFYEFLTLPALDMFRILQKHYPEAASYLDPASDKQSATNRSTFAAGVQPLMPLCKAWANSPPEAKRFSVREWLKPDYQGRRHIIVQPCEGETGAYYIGAMLGVAARIIINPSFTKVPEGVIFLLDELPALGKIEALGKGGLLDKGRSMGISLWLGFQSINQLRAIYGREEAAAFLAMIPNAFLGRTSGGEDADYWVKAVGRQRVQKTTQSHNTEGKGVNVNEGTEERDAIMAQDLADLGPTTLQKRQGSRLTWGIAGFLLTQGQVIRLTWEGYEPTARRAAHVAAAWTLAASEREEAHAYLP